MTDRRSWFKRAFKLDYDEKFDAALELIHLQEFELESAASAAADTRARVDGIQEAVRITVKRVDEIESKIDAIRDFDFGGRRMLAQFDVEQALSGDTTIRVQLDNVNHEARLRYGSVDVVDTIDAVWFISKTGVPIDNDFGDVLHPNAQRRDVIEFLKTTSDLQGDVPLPGDGSADVADLDAKLNQEIKDREQGDAAIADALAQEVQDRADGDQALQDQIDALPAPTPPYDDQALKDDLAQEVKDREDADKALDQKIENHLNNHPSGGGGSGWEPPGPVDTDLGMYHWEPHNNVTYGHAGYTPMTHHQVSDAIHWNLNYHNKDRLDNDKTQDLADIMAAMDDGAQFTITVGDWRGSATWPITQYTNHAFDQWVQFDIDKNEVEGDSAFLNSDVTNWPYNSHELTFTFTNQILTYEELIALEHEHHVEGDADLQAQIDANKAHSHSEYAPANHIHDGDTDYGQWRGAYAPGNHLEQIAPGGVGMSSGLQMNTAQSIYIHREMPDGSMAAPDANAFRAMFAHPDRFFELNDNYFYHRWIIASAQTDSFNSDIVKINFQPGTHETNEGSRHWNDWIPSGGKTLNVEIKFPQYATQKELDALDNTVYDLRTEFDQEVVDRTEGDQDLQDQIDALNQPDTKWMPVDGGEFTGPIFGPTLDLVTPGEAILKGDNGRPTGTGSTVGQLFVWHTKVADATTTPNNELKFHVGQGRDDLVGRGEVTVWLAQGDKTQTWHCNDSGWLTDANRVWHVSAQAVEGDDLVNDVDTEVWITHKWTSTGEPSAYATLEATEGVIEHYMAQLPDGVDPAELDKKVNKAGDQLTGDLSFRLTSDQRFHGLKHQFPKDENGVNDGSEPFGTEVNIDIGNTYKSRFRVSNRYGWPFEVTGGADPTVRIGPINSKQDPNDPDNDPDKYVPLRLSGDPQQPMDAANKKYVDDAIAANTGPDLINSANRWENTNDYLRRVQFFRDSTIGSGTDLTVYGQVAGSTSTTSPLFSVGRTSLSTANTDYVQYTGRTTSGADIQNKLSMDAAIKEAKDALREELLQEIADQDIPVPRFYKFPDRIESIAISGVSDFPMVEPASYFMPTNAYGNASWNEWPGNISYLNIKINDELINSDLATAMGNFTIRDGDTNEIMVAGMINDFAGKVTMGGKPWERFHVEKWGASGTRWQRHKMYYIALSGTHWEPRA